MRAAIVIPARYASTRLPGKALLDLAGKPVIRHVYERAAACREADRIVVATDDERIRSAVSAFGGEAVMTRADHGSGTDRVAEAARGLDAEIIVNLQGDEPELDPGAVDRLIALQREFSPFASTLCCPFPAGLSPDDPSQVKVVLGPRDAAGAASALYFSRAPIPFARDPSGADHFLHIGVYAFSRQSLFSFCAAPRGRLEAVEHLEQLRILEMGETLLVVEIADAAAGIDTHEDLEAARARFSKGAAR